MDSTLPFNEKDAGAVFLRFQLPLIIGSEIAGDKFFLLKGKLEGKLSDLIFIESNPPLKTARATALTNKIKRRIQLEAKVKPFFSSENTHQIAF